MYGYLSTQLIQVDFKFIITLIFGDDLVSLGTGVLVK